MILEVHDKGIKGEYDGTFFGDDRGTSIRRAHPELAPKLQLFGQFVRSWDVEVINYKPYDSREVVQGEWHFGWALEGRAIQDVWIAPKRSLRASFEGQSGEYGATLRFYDPKIDGWRSTWIGPVKGYVLPFVARQVGDEIVLEGSFKRARRGNGYSPTLRANRLTGALSNLTTGGLARTLRGEDLRQH